MTANLWFLRRLDLFQGLDQAELQRIGALFDETACRPGQEFQIGGANDRVYVLKAGRVRVMRGDVVLAVLEPGHLFGTSAFLGVPAAGERVVAVDDSIVCETTASAFLNAVADSPRLAARMVRIMAEQMAVLQAAVAESVSASVPERLAALLLRIARTEDARLVVRDVAEAEMAAMIGASRESVSRLVHRWEREGLVHARPLRIEIVDEASLRAAASGAG